MFYLLIAMHLSVDDGDDLSFVLLRDFYSAYCEDRFLHFPFLPVGASATFDRLQRGFR